MPLNKNIGSYLIAQMKRAKNRMNGSMKYLNAIIFDIFVEFLIF